MSFLCYKRSMKIQEIYDRYDIMPNLREHQLRVAGVAKYICNQLSEKDFSERDLITACLLHDMGNIVKADLSVFPEFITPELLPRFEKQKKEMMEKYHDEHDATLGIARELGVGLGVYTYLENARLLKFNEKEAELAVQIYNYADMRVHPFGIRALQERLDNLRARYETKKMREGLPPFNREAFEKRLHEFEDDIFSCIASVRPQDITDESIAPLIAELQTFDIELAS
jgi:5'-deoxynucleotidase YfbR-like HD superfamily hydrolase